MNNIRLFSTVLIVLLFLTKICFAQSSIKGIIMDNEKVPLPFANVAIYSTDDTTSVKYGTITDLNGNYTFPDVSANSYYIIASFTGFKNRKEVIEIKSDMATPLLLNLNLEPDVKLLNSVTVQESRVSIQRDKSTYTILPSDIKRSRNALDLTTIIPQILYDPVNDKISSANGKAVKILVNGLNATEIELKTIKPNNISKIEHYDIPPARYADFDAVINIITKVAEDGFAAGGNLSTAFTTGFGNDMLYFKYNKGKSQIGVDYSLYHRNYKNNKIESSYDYIFNDTRMQRDQFSNSAFGYDDNYINITYINQKESDYAVKLKVSPNYMTRHTNNSSEILYNEGENQFLMTGTEKQRANILSPSADLYIWKQVKRGHELAVNLVGTGFNTKNEHSKMEYKQDGTLVLEDNMLEKNRKISFIGEANYSIDMKKVRFNSGYSIETNKLNSKVENSFQNVDYNTSFLKNYLYSEISGNYNRFNYKASFGVTNIVRETFTDKFNDWVFRPSVVIGYNLKKAGSLNFQYRMFSTEPSLASLSNNKVYVTEHIIRQGNPNLRHSITNELIFDWSRSSKYLDFKLMTIYQHVDRPINRYFSNGDEYITIAAENGDFSKNYGIAYSGTIKPFSNNIVSVRFSGQVIKTELSSDLAGSYSHIYSPLWYQINFQHKNWWANYQGNIVGKSLSGPYLNSNENQSNISIGYTKGDLTLYTSCYWFLTKAKYRTSTIPESLVKYSGYSYINDNKSMIVIGISYNFFKGKRFNEKASKLRNADRDAGMF